MHIHLIYLAVPNRHSHRHVVPLSNATATTNIGMEENVSPASSTSASLAATKAGETPNEALSSVKRFQSEGKVADFVFGIDKETENEVTLLFACCYGVLLAVAVGR